MYFGIVIGIYEKDIIPRNDDLSIGFLEEDETLEKPVDAGTLLLSKIRA